MLTKDSFAKINLYLEVVGKDKRNYHLLDSLMTLIDIKDKISIEESNALSLEIKGSDATTLQQKWQENIIIRAVKLLAENHHFDPKIKITLEKNIPVSAGLGGGSSNAATVLLMLNEFYNLNLSKEKLLEYGLKLGADVPFFINSKMAIATGIGEVLEPISFDTKNLFLIIVNPKKPLSTAEVFERCSEHLILNNHREAHADKTSDLVSFIKHRHNDLQNTAIMLMPEIFEILEEIKHQENCQIARMSGSGASCFGIFKSDKDQELAYTNLIKHFPNFYIQKARII